MASAGATGWTFLETSMATLFEWTDEKKREWDAWVAERPECVRVLCKRLPPNKLYRMKSTGQRVTIAAYAENGTVRVNITGQYNALVFEREVFGIDADDLEECDVPAPDEPVGAILTEEGDVKAFIDLQRPNAGHEPHGT